MLLYGESAAYREGGGQTRLEAGRAGQVLPQTIREEAIGPKVAT